MIQTLIGQKAEQSQKFLENGRRIPVTKISMSDNAVLQVKTVENDAYASVQLGFGGKRKTTNALAGHIKKAGVTVTPQTIKEVALEGVSEEEMPKAGDMIALETVFKAGDTIDVTGTSKGKGFAGVVKRHGFRGGPKTHGQSDRHRAPGSIGQTTTPGRVYKGKKMAGRMGHETVTITNLTVVDVDAENKTMLVCGLVPGSINTFLLVTRTGEDSKFVPLLETVQREEAKAALESQAAEEEAKKTVVEETVEVEETKEEAQAEEAVETKTETVEEEKTEAASDAVEVESKEEVTSDVTDENIKEEKEDGK